MAHSFHLDAITADRDVPTRAAYGTGTGRTIDNEETVRRTRRFWKRAGLTRLADITGLDTVGIPVATAYRPASRGLVTAQGKGVTWWASAASAVMESLESWHAEQAHQHLEYGTFHDLSNRVGHRPVNPRGLARPTGSPWSPHTPLLWANGTDLFTGETVLVPHECVHTDYSASNTPGAGCFVVESNGLASGNHLLEAVAHGLLELIERDACALFDLMEPAEQHRRRLDASALARNCAEVTWLLERFAEAGVSVALWDITSDIGVPTVLCHCVDTHHDPFRSLPAAGGMGTHPDPRIAAIRALTEAAQSRLIYIAGARDDLLRGEYARAFDTEGVSVIRTVVTDEGAPVCEPPPPILTAAATLGDVVDGLLGMLQAAGLEQAVVVDLTRPDIELPVARVIVPGLEGAATTYGGQVIPGARARSRVPQEDLA